MVEHVERLTAIRKLTMTCWHLRNTLFPLLWEHVEGCNVFGRRPAPRRLGSDQMVPLKNGLYAQCLYLVRNPTIGAHVKYVQPCVHLHKTHEVSLCRAISADLRFKDAPKDLMTKFVDCLAQLPNLTALEVFGADQADPIIRAFNKGCVLFPNIRELWVGGVSAEFLWFSTCPNVESVTVTSGISQIVEILCLRGKELKRLKRVAGVHTGHVLQGKPKGIF